MNLMRDPVPYIRAEPLPTDMLEWHYCIQGPEDTPYVGGYYHGTLIFTQQYPFKPPSIYMLTPNGRFEVNRRLCLSISDYHPDEWNPSWCVSSILTGLLSFMLENSVALGTIETSTVAKVRFARASLSWNVKQARFRELFPDVSAEIDEKLRVAHEKLLQRQAANGGSGVGADGEAGGDGAEALAANNAPAVDYMADDLGYNGAHQRWAAAAGMGTEMDDWQSVLNNLLLMLFTGLLALIGYHVFGIMSAE